MGRKLNIFMIYVREDSDIMGTLLHHLKSLNPAFDIAIWHDAPIHSGEPWKPHIESRLDHTDIFILLVSVDFMNSQFIRQTEFNTIIDRHKENKSVVIPVIIDDCQWDIDLKFIDQEFNLNELVVLPEEGKPIWDWNSPDHAYINVATGVKKAIASFANHPDQEGSKKDKKMKRPDTKKEDREQINIEEDREATGIAKEGKLAEEEIGVKREVGEENRLWQEAEAKRRAEVAKRIREATEASAKKRDKEEKKAEAIRIAKVEKRIRDAAEAAANRSFGEEKRLMEEADARRIAKEENRLKEAAEAKKIAEEENSLKEAAEATARRRDEEEKSAEARKRANEEEKRAEARRGANEENNRKKEEEIRKNTGEEKLRKEEAAASLKAENERRLKQEVETKPKTVTVNPLNLTGYAHGRIEETRQRKNTAIKKRVLAGSFVAVLIIVGIWAFSVFITGTEKQSPPLPKINATAVKDSIDWAKTTSDSLKKEEALSKPAVGDTYEGGIVFTIDQAGKTGKIAHPQDAGPMTWKNAMKIQEQLGDEWRLPTFDELRKMYETIGQGATNSGQFTGELYWSATPYDDYQARLIRFRDGNTSFHYNIELERRKYMVRAIRDFSR